MNYTMADSKIRVVLVSHGEQSKGMLNTVQMLLGEQTNIAAYSLYPEQTIDDLTKVLREEIEKYGAENIIFLTELKHGSPFNAVVSLTRDYDVYHVTGTNLAMLVISREQPVRDCVKRQSTQLQTATWMLEKC